MFLAPEDLLRQKKDGKKWREWDREQEETEENKEGQGREMCRDWKKEKYTVSKERQQNKTDSDMKRWDIDSQLMHKYLCQQLLNFLFQNRKRSSQSYPHHHPFTSLLTLPNITLHPPYLPVAFPFPCSIKAGLSGVWTKDQESLSQKLFTHGAACLLARYSQACKGGLWLNSKNRKIWGFFFFSQVFGKKAWEEGIGRNSGGFVQHLIKTPQMPIFAKGNVWLRIKCWVASDDSVNGHAIKALRETLKGGGGGIGGLPQKR